MLTEKDLKEAKALAIRLKTQDNRSTALPVFFLLQDVEEIRAFDSGDFVLFVDQYGDEWKGEDEDDIINQILQVRLEDDEDVNSEDLEDEIRNEVEGKCYEMDRKFITKRVFLTEEAAQNHLKANNYHYSDKARIYVEPCWRDPEMELVYKILTSFDTNE